MINQFYSQTLHLALTVCQNNSPQVFSYIRCPYHLAITCISYSILCDYLVINCDISNIILDTNDDEGPKRTQTTGDMTTLRMKSLKRIKTMPHLMYRDGVGELQFHYVWINCYLCFYNMCCFILQSIKPTCWGLQSCWWVIWFNFD